MWYRTVLQVILLEKFYSPVECCDESNITRKSKKFFRNKFNASSELIEPTRIQVGRNLIKEKCKSEEENPYGFSFYVRKALTKLNFTNHEQQVIILTFFILCLLFIFIHFLNKDHR